MAFAGTSLLSLAVVVGTLAMSTVAHTYELAGGAEDGKFHRLSAAIAKIASGDTRFQGAEELNPLPTDGFVDNARLLRDNEAQFALIDSIAAYWVGEADGPFAGERPFDELNVVAILWYNVDHFLVSQSALRSGTIADFGDVTGARVSLSDQAKTQINANERILGELGTAVDASVDVDSVSGPASFQRLDYAQIGGLAVTAPMPSALVTEAIEALPDGGVLVGLTSGQFAGLTGSRQGAWSAYSIPAGTYPGQESEIDTTSHPIMLVTRADVSEDDVYRITSALFSNLPALAEESTLAGLISLDNAVSEDLRFPLHPGASRYYQEVGLITGDDVFERLQTSQDPLAVRDSTIDPWKAYRPLQSILFSGTAESERSRTFVSFFDFNSVDLDEPAEATVQEIADFGKSLGNAEIYVAGHADRAGSRSVNERVARARADSVVRRLVELGYDEALITAEGFGEDRPAISTADDEEHQQNRRVETIVTLPADDAPVVASLEGTPESAVENDASVAARAEPTGETAETATAEGASDGELPRLLVENTRGGESDGALTLDLKLSAPSSLPIVLIVTQLNGTAIAGEDFETAPSVITLRPGETVAELKTVLVDDDLAEGDESFELRISGSRDHVDIPAEPVVLTIEDDD